MLGQTPGPLSVSLGLVSGLAIWCLFFLPAVWRLQRKLGPGSKPTWWTYLNELGGYVVVGLILAGTLLFELVRLLVGG